MDFVKREDQHILDDENYKFYVESLQKSHQLEAADYQHAAISMEQLHQAMQSSVTSSIVHNFQLPLSPRQMSSLMLKTNHLPRNLNFNDIPAHLPRNLTTELDLHNLTNDLPQNLNRHDDLLTQNLSRNLDLSLRNLSQDLDLHNNLSQLAQNLNENLSADLSRISDLRADIPHDLSHDIDLGHHLNRQSIEQEILSQDEARRTPMVVQCVQDSILDQSLAPRLVSNLNVHDRLVQTEHVNTLPMPFHIKSEQEDDGYFYDTLGHGINSVGSLNGLPADPAPQSTIHPDNQLYTVYNGHANIPALNPLDLYSRQTYIHNFTNTRENPQNLVVHRQFDNTSPYQEEFKKLRQDSGTPKEKLEEPKENLKPSDQNKIYYSEYNQNFAESKNENDPSVQNKITEDISMNIKGQYVCYKCNEVFPSKRGLKHHSKTCADAESLTEVEKVGKFSCSQCAYRCQSPAILKIHERTHSGEKPFACTFCDYKSGQKNNVAKHILVHMKEKPFRCQYCDYRCAQKNNLVVHERTHTGYKPFACPFCDYRTVQKPNLVKHMYLHTDQKPFSCDMCSYRCVQKTNLTKHKQRHINEKEGDKLDVKNQIKPYRPRQKSVKCPQCPYRCVQKASMEKHMQFKHGLEQDGRSGEGFDQGLNLMKDDEETFDQGLNLMKGDEETINLSVRKDYESDKRIIEDSVAT